MAENHAQTHWPVWATESIDIVEPHSSWLEKRDQEKKQLLELLSPFGINQVRHIGSTSIPGLPAKPIIKILCHTHSQAIKMYYAVKGFLQTRIRIEIREEKSI